METKTQLEKTSKSKRKKAAAPRLVQVVARISSIDAEKIDEAAAQQKIPVSRAKFVASILSDWVGDIMLK